MRQDDWSHRVRGVATFPYPLDRGDMINPRHMLRGDLSGRGSRATQLSDFS